MTEPVLQNITGYHSGAIHDHVIDNLKRQAKSMAFTLQKFRDSSRAVAAYAVIVSLVEALNAEETTAVPYSDWDNLTNITGDEAA
jgi:hypothetical protein